MVMRGSEEDKVDSGSEQEEVEKEGVNGLVSFDSGTAGDVSRQDSGTGPLLGQWAQWPAECSSPEAAHNMSEGQ